MMQKFMRREARRLSLLGVIAAAVIATACSSTESGPSEELISDVIENYADGVYASYSASLASTRAMDSAIDAFIANPTQATLDEAKQKWLEARDDYTPTEAFRFYGGPIDSDEDGVEGLVNAWPLDESYIDYVDGNAESGIVNMAAEYPEIDADLLLSLNEEGGETNISTGWHAIEFLLWGQDLSETGPGNRPVTDYTTAENAERRKTYLSVASDLLVTHMEQVTAAWDPAGGSNYRATFLALPSNDALNNIITGIGELSRGELAGERMTVAYEVRSQEDEHSCFSDNTTADIIGDALGIQMVYTGDYPGGVSGPGIHDLVAAADEDLAERLEQEIAQSVTLTRAIPAPFDQHLREGVPNSDPGRQAILAAIEALETQTDSIVAGAQAIDVTITVS